MRTWFLLRFLWGLLWVKRPSDGEPPPYLAVENILIEIGYGRKEFGFYALVGLITTSWGRIEYMLDWTNIYSIGWSKTKKQPLPKSLEPKIALFAKTFRENETLAKFRERAEILLTNINQLKEVRHDLVHGRFFEKQINEGREFARFTYEPGELGSQKKRVYKFLELIKHQAEAQKLADEMHSFFVEFRQFLIDEHEKAKG